MKTETLPLSSAVAQKLSKNGHTAEDALSVGLSILEAAGTTRENVVQSVEVDAESIHRIAELSGWLRLDVGQTLEILLHAGVEALSPCEVALATPTTR